MHPASKAARKSLRSTLAATAALGLLALAPCLASAPAQAQDQSQAPDAGGAGANASGLTGDTLVLDAVANAVDDAIRPGYQAFDDAVREQAFMLETLCSDPTKENLQSAQENFGGLVSAFSKIEFVRFGPIREDNRLERILFFPDPRGVMAKQVQAILKDQADNALHAETLAEKSVAVQGLPALQYVLFGDGSDDLATESGAYRCSYGKAIAANLSSISTALVEEWGDETGISERLMEPAEDDPVYRTASDSLGAIVSIFTEGLEIVADQRLSPPLSAEDGADAPAKPNLFLFGASDNALTALQGDFEGLQQLFEAVDFPAVLPADKQFLGPSIELEFTQIGSNLDAVETPLSEAVADADSLGKLGYVLIATRSLRSQFTDQLAPALGLASGFSSLDGD
ncbi:peptidase M75, Imelysin [Fulvimarina endophytica]|uniref:Peptidase M75, Imelysin n=1 Tax=Fulvimarina endophytica TaxID=2293836 RepID=A0A371X4B8_9HYPH|nr:imelysin family protein [Fulvimarina endophytica]RFC64057.1 peptidase M75, Imelysin [Fulvimarina endophytica]